MKVKLDLDIKCQCCGELEGLNWQITKNIDKDKLLIDIMCPSCKQYSRQIIKSEED